MNIFVINSGSSSIKYQLFKMPNETPVCSGLVERIGLSEPVIIHKLLTDQTEQVIKKTLNIPDHEVGLHEVVALLTDEKFGVIRDPREIHAVGHRVVHGGESFKETTIITQEIKDKIKELFPLAPLHNPANYLGIEVAEKIFPQAKQVAVFDTAFHQTMPEKAFRYAIPESFYKEKRIRAYGFHGTSHKYVSEKAMEFLGNNNAKLITIHLGNGCSMTAVQAGMSVETSMGFGPVSGLVMGTRCGDIDASVIFHLMEQLAFSPAEVSDLLNKKSGMVGLTGFSDMRDILRSVKSGNREAAIAFEMYIFRIKKYIGAYAAALNGLDAIVFTAGVGENSAEVREAVCRDMEFFGLQLNADANVERSQGTREINQPGAPVKILVIPTNEELEIVKQCYRLLH